MASNLGFFSSGLAEGMAGGFRRNIAADRNRISRESLDLQRQQLQTQQDLIDQQRTAGANMYEGLSGMDAAKEAQKGVQYTKQRAAQAQDHAKAMQFANQAKWLSTMPKSIRAGHIKQFEDTMKQSGVVIAPNFLSMMKQGSMEELKPYMDNLMDSVKAGETTYSSIMQTITDPQATTQSMVQATKEVADPRNAHNRRVQAAQTKLDNMLRIRAQAMAQGASPADIQHINSLIQTQQNRVNSLSEGSRVTAMSPGGTQPFAAIETGQGELIHPETRENMPRALKVPMSVVGATPGEVSGGLKKDTNRDKVMIQIDDQAIVTQNMVNGIGDLVNRVASPDYVTGTAGRLLTSLNSFAKQVGQLQGVSGRLFNERGDYDHTALDKSISDENRNAFERAADESDVVAAEIVHLAYMKAKIDDPAGRISDADFKYARSVLESGSKQAMVEKLTSLMDRAESNYNTFRRIKSNSLGQPYGGDIRRPDLTDVLGEESAAQPRGASRRKKSRTVPDKYRQLSDEELLNF